MARNILTNMTDPYSAAESFLYDAIVAPAVVRMRSAAEERLIDQLPPGAELLEVGSGGGQLARHIAERRPDARITGLDLSPQQVARATRRGRALAERLRFVEGSALDLPFPERSFDAVLSVASIKHWPDQARGMKECVRVLRPGGLLCVVEADRSCHLEDAREFVRHWRLLPAMRPFALMLFRTYVAGQGLDLEDARALLAKLPLEASEAGRIPGAPALIMLGKARP